MNSKRQSAIGIECGTVSRTDIHGLLRRIIALIVFSGVITACGRSPGVATSSTNDPLSPPTGCAAAPFPSAEWTQCELQNLAVVTQNPTQHADLTAGILADTAEYQASRLAVIATDPERQPNPNSCTSIALCPIDPRVQNWEQAGGLVEPVLYTSRSGATMSGHVWATREGAAKRPGVVIINGSIVGYEPIYWYAAQALAKAGFVVMTFDAQGEGMSDQFGEAPDQMEDAFAGIPALGVAGPVPAAGVGLGGNGLPFYDGGSDAINFFLSTPNAPYVPVLSRSSGTSHAAKQTRRVAAGLNQAYNPLWQMLDTARIGVAGHSYGAVASSWLVQQDSRLTTAVAWDALCLPVSPSPDEVTALTTAPVNQVAGAVGITAAYGLPTECFGAPAGTAPAITKPALGITADYLIVPAPYLAPPKENYKAAASMTYSRLGIDTGTIIIRGGTHFDFNDVPLVLPASLRGIDMVTWYTTAWFLKYLKNDPAADAMLTTKRWQNDAVAASVDPAGDGNIYSWHYASRLSIKLSGGGRFDCESLRFGCTQQVDASKDGGPASYSFAQAVAPASTP